MPRGDVVLNATNLKVTEIKGEPSPWQDSHGNDNLQYDVVVMDPLGELHDAEWSKRETSDAPFIGEVVFARLEEGGSPDYPPKLKTVQQGGQQRSSGGGQRKSSKPAGKKGGSYDNTGARIGFAYNAGLAFAKAVAELRGAKEIKFEQVRLAAGWFFAEANAVEKEGEAYFARRASGPQATQPQLGTDSAPPPPPAQPRADEPTSAEGGSERAESNAAKTAAEPDLPADTSDFDAPPPPSDDDIPF